MRADQTELSYPLTALGKFLGGFSRLGGKETAKQRSLGVVIVGCRVLLFLWGLYYL